MVEVKRLAHCENPVCFILLSWWTHTFTYANMVTVSFVGCILSVLSQATKNKTFTSKNTCSSATKGRSHGEYLA
jgi:hypothetical protein